MKPGDITPGQACILREALTQKLAKEMVVTIPVSLNVKWDEKQIGALDGVEGRLPRADRIAENRIAQRPAQTIEDRCVQQEAAGWAWAAAGAPLQADSPAQSDGCR